MKSIQKLSEAMTESTDARVIAEIFYEQNCPRIHKEVMELLIRRFLSEMNLVDKWNNHVSDACNLLCEDYEEFHKRFHDWLNLDQVRFLNGE